jgi:uncharacterized Zn ribbon protein
METQTCPNCGNANDNIQIVDEDGGHYTCPDCAYKWSDCSKCIEDV